MHRIITVIAILALLFISFAALYIPNQEVKMTGYMLAPYESDFGGDSNYVVNKAVLKGTNG